MHFTLLLEDGSLCPYLVLSGHIQSFLQGRRAVLQVNVMIEYVLFSLQVHERDTGLDRLGVSNVRWHVFVGIAVLL